MPWSRVARLQSYAGIPLPASDQWELLRDAVEQGPRDAYQHLFWLGAQGNVIYNDDTTARVLELMEKTKRQEPLLEEDPERRGVFTTGVVSKAEGRPDIALFFTGPHHAGENLRTLLASRSGELPPPIQMCDPLSRNMPDDLRVIIANCLLHYPECVFIWRDSVKQRAGSHLGSHKETETPDNCSPQRESRNARSFGDGRQRAAARRSSPARFQNA
jgi:hypothetical protein